MNGAVDLPLDRADLTFAASGDALVSRSVLPSGVRVLSEHVPGVRSATIGFWFGVGSRDETGLVPGPSGHAASFGSTHFLEHLLFKGTRDRTAFDIAISFDAVGGEHNALTAKEQTCYYAKVQDRDLSMATEVLADMVTSSLLDATDFENERGVILEELAMAEDDPADAVNERFFSAVLGDHPVARPIGGNPDTINAATRDAVWQHYQANYRPQDLVVAAAGAVDHGRLVADVERALAAGGWPMHQAGSPVERRGRSDAAIDGGSPLVTVRRPIEQTHLVIGTPGLRATDDARITMSVLNAVLGGGMSSRLFQEVREKRGLAYSVYSFAAGYSDTGVFGMYAACAPQKTRSVASIMVDELQRLAADGISHEELARAVGQLSGGSALALEDSDTRMTRLGRSELSIGEFSDLDETLRRIALVTADDVRDLAHRLASRPLTIAAVGAVDDDVLSGLV
ncbi:M16 family metallopeptidase [Humibacter ginsenosidimutans]|uniref:Insulinase family protein n=1 Tax=Humibacter ginsenosidimutans TaxID=2599293 RepID=A0A5B8M1B3_9MICO|nr:pitrilysin family protein [Humibacter ginsenosidimutans]QDZ13502.1 insulinase family protein [Humibacter ginsenosidimutans]